MSWISDVKHDLSKLDLSVKSLKKFGLTVGFAFILFFVLASYLNWNLTVRYIFLAAGFLLTTLGFIFPSKLGVVYKVWMGFAFVLGWLVSRIILTVLFFIVLFPVGLIAKIFGKKFLEDKMDRNSVSYWIKKENSKIDYEKMF